MILAEKCNSIAVATGNMIAALLAAQENSGVPVPPIIVDALMESSISGRPLGTILEDYARSEAEAVDAAIESLVAMSHSSDEKERQCAGRLIAQISVSTPRVKNFKIKKLKEAEEKYGPDLYPHVRNYLNDADTDVQIYAIELLGRVSKWDSDEIDYLKQIKEANTSARVKEALEKAIHSMEGRKPSGIPEAGFYVSVSAPGTIRFYHGIVPLVLSSAEAGFTGSLGYRFPFKLEHCNEPPPGWSIKSCHDDYYSQLRLSGNIIYERRGDGMGMFVYSGVEGSDSHDVGGYFDAEYSLTNYMGPASSGVNLIVSFLLLGTGHFKQALLSLLNFSIGYKRAFINGDASRYGDQEILQLSYKVLRLEKEFGYGFGVRLAFLEPYYTYLLSHKKEFVEEFPNRHVRRHDWGLGFSMELYFRTP